MAAIAATAGGYSYNTAGAGDVPLSTYPQPGIQPGYAPQPGYGQPAPAGYGQPPPVGYVQPGYGYPQPQVGPVPQMTQPPGNRPQPQFMAAPQTIPGVPQGLEYLSQIDQLLVHQQVEIFELFTGFETCNKYQVKNTLGQQVYFAGEESDMCMRQCCGPSRGFTMHITNNFGQEVIRVMREFKCCAGINCCAGCQCCSMEIRVEAPVGQTIGYVRQQRSCLAPKYYVQDAQEQTVLMIEGPICICQGPCCTWDQEFKVLSRDGAHQVGKISKQWSGFVKEYFTDADNFGVSFPMDLDVRVKATLLGAVFLIDFMFFEQNQNNNNN
jgi:uncharacterized protein YxjI